MNSFTYNSTDDTLLAAASSILQGSLQEAKTFVSKGIYTLDGKKIEGARSSKLFLQALDADGFLNDLSWKEWSESNLKDTSSDYAKKQFIERLAKQIKMFNKRIDLNTFLKSGNINFIDTVNYIFKLDPNIKYSKASGLKEDTLQEDENFYAEEMIKNQLETIIRNSSECMDMIEHGLKFPEWAQSKIAVAEDGIVSVTEFMQSHYSDKGEIEEAALKQILPTKENKQRLALFMKKFNALRDAFPDVVMRGMHNEKVEAGLIDNGNVVQYLNAKIPFVHDSK